MKIDLMIDKTTSLNFDMKSEDEYLLGLWIENTMTDEEFLNLKKFKDFCSNTIGGEHYSTAKDYIVLIKEQITILKTQGFDVELFC